MELKQDEQIVKVFHHHLTARLFRALKIMLVSIPFYFVAALFQGFLVPMQMFFVYGIITLLFGGVLAYDSILYYLDRLILTNKRIVYIDWQGALTNVECEAALNDIQDIATKEKGIFAMLPIFDYGEFRLETASSHTTIIFPKAPDPEGIKNFIYHLNRKPNRIVARSVNALDDQKAKEQQAAPDAGGTGQSAVGPASTSSAASVSQEQ